MTLWKKIGLVVLGALSIAVAGVYFLVRSVLAPATVELYIIPRLEEIVRRPIAYGQIDIGMGGAIRIQDVSVGDGDTVEGTPLVASREVVLRCRILPLLYRKVVIDRIVLREPHIRLERNAEGQFNVSSPVALPAKKDGTETYGIARESQPPAIILTFNLFTLHDGTLTFTDYGKRPAQPLTTTCNKIDAEVSDFSITSPFSAALSAEFESTPSSVLKIKAVIDPVRKQVTSDIKLTAFDVARIAPYVEDLPLSLTAGRCSLEVQVSANSAFDFSSRGTLLVSEPVLSLKETPVPRMVEALADLTGRGGVDINHRVSYQAAGDVLTLEDCKVTLHNIAASIQGKVDSMRTDPHCDMTVTTGKLLARTVIDILPADMQRAFVNLSAAGTAEAGLSIKGRLKETDTLAVNAFVLADNLSLQSETPPRWNIALRGKMELNNRDLVMDRLTATTGTSAISMTGKAAHFLEGPLAAQLSISSPSLDVEEVAACIEGLGNLRQKLWDRDAGLSSETKRLIRDSTARISAEAALDRVSYRDLKLSNLKANGRWAGNCFTLESLQGVMGDGAFTASGLIKPGDEGPDYTCRFTGNHLPLSPVFQSLAPGRTESISGTADLALNLQGRGATADALKRNLSGEATFTIEDGTVSGLSSLQSLASFIKIDALNTLTFEESQGTLQVGDGAIRLQSSMRGNDMELYPAGTIGLDSALDLLLDVRLAPRLSDQLADGVLTRYFKDEKGWTVLSLSVKGPAGEAVVMPASSTIKRMSEMLVDILLKKEDPSGNEKEDKKKALEDLLQRLMQPSKVGGGTGDVKPPSE